MRKRPSAVNKIDFYKTGHIFQYEPGTQFVYSNLTARSAKHSPMLRNVAAAGFRDEIVVAGLQMFVQDRLIDDWNETFFGVNKDKVVSAYRRRMDTSLGKGAISVDHIAALHDLGHLPLRIKALPEGERCSIRVPFMTFQNTDPDFFWITNYLEDIYSVGLWKIITTATIAYGNRNISEHYAAKTGTPKAFVPFQFHDFSMRGMSTDDDAAYNGVGHLSSFVGTDTVPAIDMVEAFYGDNAETTLIGASVPATEHSVMCVAGPDAEIETYRRLISDVYPRGVVSIVSDTWDFWRVITKISSSLKDQILARQPDDLGMAKVVFRPDSGDPYKIIVGDPDAPAGTPAAKGAVQCLWEIFGGTVTSTGHRQLDSHVGLIYGDSITIELADRILAGLADSGFASGNIVFGVGSYTYQGVTRDSLGMAVKATWSMVNGQPREMFKDPITDSGEKKSACGLVRVEKVDGRYVMFDRQTVEQEQQGCLLPLFENGRLLRHTSLQAIRERLWPDFYGLGSGQ
jgi:nicotinamide phosphoribosyltransferase